MKKKLHFPKKTEIAIIAALAVVLAAIATVSGKADTMMALFTVPLFFVFALLGLSRSEKRKAVPVRQEARSDRQR